MGIPNILSAAAIILGIYILLAYLLGQKTTPTSVSSSSSASYTSSQIARTEFHVGCYLTDHEANHYSGIISKLRELEDGAWRKETEYRTLVPGDYVDRKGVQVAKNFDSFIKEYNNYKSRAMVNVELSRAVTVANLDFKRCLRDLNTEVFSESDCLLNWELYLKCSTQLGTLKNSLNFELGEKNAVMDKAKALLNPQGPSKVASSGPQEDYPKQYRKKDRQLKDLQDRYLLDLKLLNERVSQAEYNHSVAKNKTMNSYLLYSECSDHRSQYRLCQELNEEMLNLGHGSIEGLEKKVEKKQNLLMKIKKWRDDSQARGESSAELKKLYDEYLEEHRKLLKLYIETKAKIKKHCGCTESEESNLKQEVDRSRRQEEEKLRQLNRYIDEHAKKLLNVNKIKEQRRILMDDLDQKMKKVSSHRPKPKDDPIDLLSQLERQRQKHETQILSLNTQFSDLQRKCSTIKARLTNKIETISKIKDCRNKYQYYQQLKSKFDREKPKEIKMDPVLKRSLIQSVEDFRY